MKRTKLSEADAFGSPITLTISPTYTAIHVVPEGEKHLVTLMATNTDNAVAVEFFGHMGAGTDVLDHDCAPESTILYMEDVMLVGPAGIRLTATVASRIRISGHVKIVD